MRMDEFDELFDLSFEQTEDPVSAGNDIAVVGMSLMAGHASNAQELWQALRNGEFFGRSIPSTRIADAEGFARYLGKEAVSFAEQSYLDRVDLFSPSFFQIPPKDAALLDPAQRLMLYTAWRAFEDGGFSKQSLAGRNIGVFVGYTAPEHQYSTILANSDPEFADRALAGTVNSIIASRISYFLDLNGPAVMVDTACSSSLVAVHLACNAIRNGDCTAALVGGVQYRLIPEATQGNGELSVTSSDGATRTFDQDAQGTNPGEGVAAIVLKPLQEAIRDKDRIYAVIKGSAINQDGASVGITAPNAAAQENVITKAWEAAGVDPEQISYIEAHGTATKLGDPIEISGIQRAFQKYTDKTQFCAIGSLKTNMGHLDSAAGIFGLIKCILALRHKELPPHLQFHCPNPKIDFIQSPVYVNDSLTPWNAPGERICGVSSFGMSGTNCHVVLQEYEQPATRPCYPMVLALSARNREDLLAVAKSFEEEALADPLNISNFIYTALLTKTDYAERFAMVVNSPEDLRGLAQIVSTYAVRVEKINQDYEICETDPEALCSLYLQGARIDWREVYADYDVHVVSCSGYPMKMERCWQTPAVAKRPVYSSESSVLIDHCITASPVLHLYSTFMSEQSHSEVREHVIGERNVLAGTVYVEMIRSTAEKMLNSSFLQIDSLIFLSPMIFEKGQVREVQTILYAKGENDIEAVIQSRDENDKEWIRHIQCKVSTFVSDAPQAVSVSELLSRMGENVMDSIGTAVDQMVTTGPRWKVQRGIWIGDNEALTMASIEEAYSHELRQYGLYPSMLDAAVNCSSVLIGNSFCLPYLYGSMRIYAPMPAKIYSRTVKKNRDTSGDGEIHVFDIDIFDENGNIIATVKDYAMKKTGQRQKQQFYAAKEALLRKFIWTQEDTVYRPSDIYDPEESTVLVSLVDQYPKALYRSIKTAAGDRAYELCICSWANKNTDRKTFVFPDSPKQFTEYFDEMIPKNPSRVVFFVPELFEEIDASSLEAYLDTLCQGYFHMIRAIASEKRLGNLRVDVLIPVMDDHMSPLASLIAGMGKSILFEYSRLDLRCILVSHGTSEQQVLQELSYNHSDYMVLLREGQRFVPQISEIEEEQGAAFSLRKNGTYMITGGSGGIGLVLAQYLASLEPGIHLILVSRSELLPQELWKEQKDEKYVSLQRIKETAASVRCISCDVSDPKAVEALFEACPTVNGLIHAAGLPGGGFVIKRSWSELLQVLRPKVSGTHALVHYAQERNMDFAVLFSSYSTVLSVAGQSDYIGANSFIDAYDRGYDRVKVLNWSGWSECGMALANGVDIEHSPVKFLNNSQGAEAFLQAMSVPDKRVLVGAFSYDDLAANVEDYKRVLRFDPETMTRIRSQLSKNNRETENYSIVVKGKDGPLTTTEEKVAQAWAKTLGLREVHYHDRFLEIGGDSLSATYLQKEIEVHFPKAMDITDVFVHSTIAQMSELIDSKGYGNEMIEIASSEQPLAITEEPIEEVKKDDDQMRKLLEMLASGEIDVSQAGQLI